jgi:hypothetical protein
MYQPQGWTFQPEAEVEPEEVIYQVCFVNTSYVNQFTAGRVHMHMSIQDQSASHERRLLLVLVRTFRTGTQRYTFDRCTHIRHFTHIRQRYTFDWCTHIRPRTPP